MSAKGTAYAIAVAGVVGLIAYQVLKGDLVKLATGATEAAKDAAQAVNPVNPENVFYSGLSAAGAALTGDKHWTLGGWLYDLTNPDISP